MKLVYSVMDTPMDEGGYGHMETIYVPDNYQGGYCEHRYWFGSCTHRSCGMAYAMRMGRLTGVFVDV